MRLILSHFALVFALLMAPAPARALKPPALPAPERFREFVEAIPASGAALAAELGSGSAATCEVHRRSIRCEDVQTTGFSAREWSIEDGIVRVSGLQMNAFRVEYAEIRSHSTRLEGITLPTIDGHAWTIGVLELDAVVRAENLAFGVLPTPNSTSVQSRLNAERALWQADAWILETVKSDGVPLGDVTTGDATSGPLPPRLRVADSTVEGDVSWLFPNTIAPILGVVSLAPGAWYGVGVGIVSRDDVARLVEAQLRWNQDTSDLEIFMSGALRAGSNGVTRLGLALEGPSDATAWRGRQLERNAWLRDVAVTDSGLNGGGDGHSFSAQVSRLAHFDGSVNAWDVFVRYGTRAEFEALRLDIDVAEWTRIRGDTEEAHSTTAALAGSVPLGDERKWWFAPRLELIGNFGVLPEELGFESSTSGQVLVGADASLAFAGRFPSLVHYLSPRAFVRREVFGFSQRPTIAPSATSFFLFERVENWTVVGTQLDQALRFDELDLRFPVGAILSGSGLESSTLTAHFALGLDVESFSTELLMVCGDSCTENSLEADGTLQLGAQVSLRASASNHGPETSRALNSSGRLLSPIASAELSQSSTSEARNWLFTGGADWTFLPWSISIRGYGALEDDLSGVRTTLSYAPVGVGWALVADAGWRFHDAEALAFVGFRTR